MIYVIAGTRHEFKIWAKKRRVTSIAKAVYKESDLIGGIALPTKIYFIGTWQLLREIAGIKAMVERMMMVSNVPVEYVSKN